MKKKAEIVTTLDIGGDKVVCVVGRPVGYSIEILGFGISGSSGYRRGSVVNSDKITNSIIQSIIDAQYSSRELIEDVNLSLNKYIISTPRSYQNLTKCIDNAGIKINSSCLNSIASGYATLTAEEKENGVVIIDIGDRTSDMAVFKKGTFAYSDIYISGGVNITANISSMRRINMLQAKELKHSPDKEVDELIAQMLKVYLNNLRRKLRKNEFYDEVQSVVLTGGSSLYSGLKDIAEKCFRKPARIGYPDNIEKLCKELCSPKFSTVLGHQIYLKNR